MTTPSNPPPLPVLAALTLGAIALAPIIGAGLSLAQLSLVPLSYGCVMSVGLYVAYLAGHVVWDLRTVSANRSENPRTVITDARKAGNEPHSPRNASCWSCGIEQGDSGISTPAESGDRNGDQPHEHQHDQTPRPAIRERNSESWRDLRSRRGDVR